MARIRTSSVQEAHDRIGDVAWAWRDSTVAEDARRYAYRSGTAHLLAADRIADAAALATTAHDDAAVRAELQRAVDDVNSRLARVETIKRFTVLPRPLDIEHGELTPTLKIKRSIVYKRWSETIDAMYAEKS
jgi:long-chain acyl-CoA synthetase